MIFLLLGLVAVHAADTPTGLCVTINDFVPDPEYMKNLPEDCDMALPGLMDFCDGNKHDWFVEVWLDDGLDTQSAKQRSHIAHNTNMPTWNEKFCWQMDQATSISIRLYDDDYHNLQSENLVEPMSAEAKEAMKQNDQTGQKFMISDIDGKMIGMVRYEYILETAWQPGEDDDCMVDNILVDFIVPDWFQIPDSRWINGPKTKLGVNKPNGYLLKTDLDIDACAQAPANHWLNTVALINWSQVLDCTLEEMVFQAEVGGAVGVIYVNDSDDLAMHDILDDESSLASIPGRIITNSYYTKEIMYTWDIHNVEDIRVKFTCPFTHEREFAKEGMCIREVWFQGNYVPMKITDADGNEVYVNVNDHAVLVSEGPNRQPHYIMMTKDMGKYRWVVTPSLTGNVVYAQCVEANERGNAIDINECEHWLIYDQEYDSFQNYYLKMIDFCPRDEVVDPSCSHTVANFVITDGGGFSDLERSYVTIVALFGPASYETEELEVVILGGANREGCDPYTAENSVDLNGNMVDLAGKLVMVFRGKCFFTDKQNNVQDAGGKAAVVVNYEGAWTIYMAHSGTRAPGTIPIRFMQQDEAFNNIKNAYKQLEGSAPLKGGFFCPETKTFEPAVLCATHETSYSEFGYYTDFHGTFFRQDTDMNGHALYRLDPLSNIHNTECVGMESQPGCIDTEHTHTYLYYSQANTVDDEGNAWKIGPKPGADISHTYAYCQGSIWFGMEDMTNPAQCDDWEIWNHASEYWQNLWWGDKTLFTEGQCNTDFSGGKVENYNDINGIFCADNSDCKGYEYCLSCNKCLERYKEQGNTFLNSGIEHPCGFCMHERAPDSTLDDGVCADLIECNSILLQGTDEETCTNACEKEGLDMAGCPVEPGCDEALCMTEDGAPNPAIFADGTCNGECFGCRAWQAYEWFDGGDCVNGERSRMVFEGSEWEGALSCEFSDPDDDSWWGFLFTTDVDMKMKLYDIKQNGNSLEMTMDITVTTELSDEKKAELKMHGITARKFRGIELPNHVLEGTAIDDEQTAWGVKDFRGTISNPGTKEILLSRFDWDMQETTTCYTVDLIQTKEGTDMSTPSGPVVDPDPVDPVLPEPESTGFVAMDMCMLMKNSECRDDVDQCDVKDGPSGNFCVHVPIPAVQPLTCFNEGLVVKGKIGKTFRFKNDKASNLTPCGCLEKCVGAYKADQTFVAYSIEKSIKASGNKIKPIAKCMCYTELKKVTIVENPDPADPNKAGEVIEGFINAWLLTEKMSG